MQVCNLSHYYHFQSLHQCWSSKCAYFTLLVALYLQVPILDEVGLNLKYKHFKRQLILASVDPELEASGALSPRNSLRFGA